MKKIKLVIFGCGKITKRIAKSCLLTDEIDLVGFASKDIEKAKAYANEYGCRDYGDYEHFLNSDIDAVYIATYNLSHYELAKACISHHKHVIAEKPFLANIEEYEEIYSLARENNVLVMEALKSVFLPVINKAKQLINDKTIGNIKTINASFCRDEHLPSDYWFYDLKTGGVLKDLGTYCIGTINYLLDIEPKLISYKSNKTDLKADDDTQVVLDYNGITANIDVSLSRDGDHKLQIITDKGELVIDDFWKTNEACYVIDGTVYYIQEELISDFYYELKHFANLVINNEIESPIMSKDASLAIIKVTDIKG